MYKNIKFNRNTDSKYDYGLTQTMTLLLQFPLLLMEHTRVIHTVHTFFLSASVKEYIKKVSFLYSYKCKYRVVHCNIKNEMKWKTRISIDSMIFIH